MVHHIFNCSGRHVKKMANLISDVIKIYKISIQITQTCNNFLHEVKKVYIYIHYNCNNFIIYFNKVHRVKSYQCII